MKNDNVEILARMRGVKATPCTPESEADPRNPNASRGCLTGALRWFVPAGNLPEQAHLQQQWQTIDGGYEWRDVPFFGAV